jgi:hypothetical protein
MLNVLLRPQKQGPYELQAHAVDTVVKIRESLRENAGVTRHSDTGRLCYDEFKTCLSPNSFTVHIDRPTDPPEPVRLTVVVSGTTVLHLRIPCASLNISENAAKFGKCTGIFSEVGSDAQQPERR